jgi:hypothetical protein
MLSAKPATFDRRSAMIKNVLTGFVAIAFGGCATEPSSDLDAGLKMLQSIKAENLEKIQVLCEAEGYARGSMAHLRCRHQAHKLQSENVQMSMNNPQIMVDAVETCRNEGYVYGSLDTYQCIRDAASLLSNVE